MLSRAQTHHGDLVTEAPMTRLGRRASLLVEFYLLPGCATLPNYSQGPWMDLDKDTRYAVEDRAGGFLVTVEHTRFQLIPSRALSLPPAGALSRARRMR